MQVPPQEQDGLQPGYEEKAFPDEEKRGRLRLVGSRDGREGSVTVHQDVDLYATVLDEGGSVSHTLAAGRKAWVHVARGDAELNGQSLSAGDGVAIDGAQDIVLRGTSEAEILLFDMA